jgi:hypothetical protein
VERVTVTKVVWSEEDAQAEVARLNELNTGNGVKYFWQISRLQSKADGSRHD